jgi:hypothetical protein
MRKNDDKANGSLTQLEQAGPTRISNRKSGIRIRPKSPEVNEVQISNRKYSPLLRSPWRIAVSDLDPSRFPRFLIYGSAIKNHRKALKT